MNLALIRNLLQMVTAVMKLKTFAPWKKSCDQPRQHIKKQRYNFANKVPSSKSYGFSTSHIWLWELDHKEGWAPKNWCFQIVVLEKILESPLDCREIKPVNSKGSQLWIFTGRTDAEAEAPVLWPPDAKSQVNGKDPDAGKDLRQEDKGMTEDEMVGWHHWLNGHDSEQTQIVKDREARHVVVMGLQRVGYDLKTEQRHTDPNIMNHFRDKDKVCQVLK